VIGRFENLKSYEQDYYHDFAITENFYIFETISMKIDFMKMAEIMYNRQPLAFGAYFDETQLGEFHIINRYVHAITHTFLSRLRNSKEYFKTHWGT